jgi:superfamily II DNA helicase RecQ
MTTLLSRLRDYRQARSTLDCVPIYCILGDAVMGSIAHTRPVTMQALLAVRGITPEKCAEYGNDILSLVRGSPQDPPPPPPPIMGGKRI